MIKILIVDDSPTEAALLKQIFDAEADMQVIGIARNGKEAIELNAALKPDIITMDIMMPIMNGVEATRIIMSEQPTPIVMISSAVNDEVLKPTFQALEAGALSVLEKPSYQPLGDSNKIHNRIIDTVRSMSEIKVIKRRFTIIKAKIKPSVLTPVIKPNSYELIAIGTSIGGPQALKSIFTKLPSDFPVPILVVQHMTKGFIDGFSSWLNQQCKIEVKNADDQEILKRGTIYFAPDHYHLTVQRSDEKLVAHLVEGGPISGFCPSATALLQSVASVCGQHSIGILLTGMGNDGAQGLLGIKNAKGLTIIQDSKSSVVFGMAGVAYSIGAVDLVVEIDQIADFLKKITQPQ